ncbi:C-C motif chemokine 20 [Labeo rohita]|uniref:C-C motif chemokine 20 n=1 Tax=Labeo rohita TaxID=84645 RepID=A0ABQ8N0Y9_LABRO|nr:C-C motif chemokine 20 [Labeo rohita]
MKFTVFAAFLFSIGWISVEDAEYDGPPPDCCLTANTQIPFENIVNYTTQDSRCLIRAVRQVQNYYNLSQYYILHKKNKTICSDPDSKWTKKAISIVEGRRTTKPYPKPATCYTSTTNMIPTTATTDKTSGTETETSTSTTVTPAVTTITTSETETSTSTTVTPTVTTIKTSTLETKISKTTLQPSVSKEKPESTATTCGTSETTAPPTETPLITSAATITTIPPLYHRKKTPKPLIKKLGKNKKGLRKGDIRPVHCCLTVSNTRIQHEDILYYDMQEKNLCPVRAAEIAKATEGGKSHQHPLHTIQVQHLQQKKHWEKRLRPAQAHLYPQ